MLDSKIDEKAFRRAIRQHAEKALGSQLDVLLLYGSRARGDANEESDTKDHEMHGVDTSRDTPSPRSLDEEFIRRAKKPSKAAAMAMLARGHSIAYLERDTPAGHVIRRHPDGRIELVKINLGIPKVSQAA